MAELEVRGRLDRVAERVAEVQRLAQPSLRLVGVHHVTLYGDVARDDPCKPLVVRVLCVHGTCADIFEQFRVAEYAMLHDLAARVREQFVRERVEACNVGEDHVWLEERACEVLACREVHGRLAADRRVDHGEERGGNLCDLDAAQVHGRGKSRHVAGHAASQGNDHVLAGEPCVRELLEHGLQRGEALVLLSGGEGDECGLIAGRPQRFFDASGIERRHVRVGDHGGDTSARALTHQLSRTFQDAHAHVHVVCSRGRLHGNDLDGASGAGFGVTHRAHPRPARACGGRPPRAVASAWRHRRRRWRRDMPAGSQ